MLKTVDFAATDSRLYVIDLDDLASQGADAAVLLNGDTLLAPRQTDEQTPRHDADTVQLKSANTIAVRLLGKPGSLLRLAVWPVQTVTLDDVTLAAGTAIEIGGSVATFSSTITNHTAASMTDVRLVTTVRQDGTRREAGEALVTCGASLGVLPVGTCVSGGNLVVSSNTGSGSGSLVPGPAEALIEVRDAASVLDSVLVPIQLSEPSVSYVVTGIHDIRAFLNQCPTDDPAYGQIRQGFELLVDGAPAPIELPCTEPFSTQPIEQLTDELIAVQVLRTAYHMSQGTEGHLPWTQKSLWDWMSSNVAGVNMKSYPGALYCCDLIDGKRYISTSRLDAVQRDFKRTWPGIASTLAYYSHEIRHTDPGSTGHTTGCPYFPLPTDPAGCDPSYDFTNLGPYGVQYWLESSWATGFLNIGIGCSDPTTAEAYAEANAESATNLAMGRFVTNPPPVVTAAAPYGGPCLATLSAVAP